MLDSLFVKNFRIFEKLEIEKLGRINLIVGRNNTGKSCLLEALHIYAQRADLGLLASLNRIREEDWLFRFSPEESQGLFVEDHPFRFFFHGADLTAPRNHIEIGEIKNHQARLKLSIVDSTRSGQGSLPLESSDSIADRAKRKRSALMMKVDFGGITVYPFDLIQDFERRLLAERPANRFLFNRTHMSDVQVSQLVFTGDLNVKTVQTWWDQVNLSPEHRERVFEMLRLIEPDLREVVFVGHLRQPTAMALLGKENRHLPLKSFGDGMNHLFHIALAMVNSRGGFLLIDEFENGLHYAVQPEIWRAIFTFAEAFDVQVFATTHSMDCISAFRSASREREDALLFHLGRSRKKSEKGRIVVASYDHEELALTDLAEMEVR
ncbi:AAA family ATPase [Sulfidibacter corallicola]|uniref:AAA family ATPase n=1 Tax=Sulfidibacter corallicola TaxID=2818388 RepID=A0A8A4TU66_SULCO|nr:AAA family ATPase [Sulfidibacter corallicola]QTD52641.1 AAA family ATPase [Sulfidibacter corallicola]